MHVCITYSPLKGLSTLLSYKKLHLGPIWTEKKRFREIFRFCEDIREKRVCPQSQQLRWHRISIVNDYANTMSARSMTMLTLCQRSQRLRGHHVSEVNDFVDMVSA